MVSYGGGLLELDRAIRIINHDIDENVSESEQLEAFKVFFKELFDTDIQNSDGGYRSIYDVFSEASKKYNQKKQQRWLTMRVEEREYIEPESINEEIINAINIVKEYCSTHEEYEDCRRCVLGDGIHNCGCSSPYLWNIRKK